MRHRLQLLLCALTFGVFLLAAQADDTNAFENASLGFKLSKPVAWRFLSSSTVAQNLAVPSLKDKLLAKAIRSKPTIPFLVLTRFDEPFDGVNPSVQVAYKTQGELAGKGPVALLTRITDRLKSNFRDFAFMQEPVPTTVDGQPAARMTARYTVLDAKEKPFLVNAWMWVVPRGDYMLTISMYGPQEGPNSSEKEFAEILKSIRLTKK